MPVWHEATRPLVAAGKLAVVAIAQEQHAERMRLYRQWKQLEWPMAHDPLNLMAIQVVPMAIAIDEQGVVRSHRATPEFLTTWVESGGASETEVQPAAAPPEIDARQRRARELVLNPRTNASELAEAIEIYRQLLDGGGAGDAAVWFEAGVAHRVLFDRQQSADDFAKSIEHWTQALRLAPNHYIYRRRIQQYGPRLDKPYPFFDWIATAQAELRERGEDPVPLNVALSGAEIAAPAEQSGFASANDIHPDPQGLVRRAKEDLFAVHSVIVPDTDAAARAVRVHVRVAVDASRIHWNEEDETPLLWIESPGMAVSPQQTPASGADETVAATPRLFEFELFLSDGAESPASVKAFLLAPVCHQDSGVCELVRFDFTIAVREQPGS